MLDKTKDLKKETKMIQAFRRSAYLILSGLMGLLMFFILQRIVVFFYLLVATLGDADFPYYRFMWWDTVSLTLVVLVGAIYGLWVGEYWYNVVYHEKSHKGLVDSLNSLLWREKPKKVEVIQHKLEVVAEKLEENLEDLEQIAKTMPVKIQPPKAVKRTIVRKKATSAVKARTPKARKKATAKASS